MYMYDTTKERKKSRRMMSSKLHLVAIRVAQITRVQHEV